MENNQETMIQATQMMEKPGDNDSSSNPDDGEQPGDDSSSNPDDGENQETMIQVNQTLETIQGIMTQASKMMEEINQETVVIINNHLNMMGILVRIKVIIIQILDQMDQIMVRKIIPIAIQIIIVIIQSFRTLKYQ